MKVVTLKPISLISSNIPEGYYQGVQLDEYASGDTYSIGDLKYYVGGDYPKVYESLENSNSGNTPPDNPTKWKDKGATDRYLMFDKYVTTQSSNTDEIEFEIDASLCNAVGLFRMQAKTAFFSLAVESNLLDGALTLGTGWSDNLDDTYTCDGTQTGLSKIYRDGSSREGILYQVKFTVSGYSAGNIAGLAGGVAGENIAANGSYIQYITAGSVSEDGLVADADFAGTVSGLSVRRVAKQETVNLNRVDINTFYDFYFAPFKYRSDVIWDLPQYSPSSLHVKASWKTGNDCKCGIVAIGRSQTLGKTQWKFSGGIKDYSKKDIDESLGGEAYFSEGDYSKRLTASARVPHDDFDTVNDIMIENRGKAAMWLFNDNGTNWQFLSLYGFFAKYDLAGDGINKTKCSFDIIGLT